MQLFSRNLLVSLMLLALSLPALPVKADELAHNFAHPPASARPWVYWFWIDGNISREGITADLEAMKRVGIGGVLIMCVNVNNPEGPVKFGSPEWREMFKFSVSEANRLGLEVNMTNAPGWCGSGGPWITPEYSMLKVVASETPVDGGQPVSTALAQPPTNRNFYRDIDVLAFPALDKSDGSLAALNPTITASVPDFRDPKTHGYLIPYATPKNPQYLQFECAQPFEARTVHIDLAWDVHGLGEIQASDDGQTFRTIRPFNMIEHSGMQTFALPATTARFFRIAFSNCEGPGKAMPIPSVDFLTTPRLDGFLYKSDGTASRVSSSEMDVTNTPTPPDNMLIHSDKVIDLTSKMDADGKLTWTPPPGKWTVLRIGYTTIGVENHPAPKAGLGLECDKLSTKAADIHFAGLMGKLIADVGPLAGKTLVMTHIDSWEIGEQNWTPLFREEFKKRRGYDMAPYFPVFQGYIVQSTEVSERFLGDVRQTVSDLLVENYAGHLQELAHEHGMKLSIEPYGDVPADNFAYGARCDEPMCEFWTPDGHGDFEMPSVAHVYGRPIVGSEAFTSGEEERWLDFPGNIKTINDWAFAEGINRMVFHRYAMQPWLNHAPGMSMGPFGLHYERTQTWWEESGPWHEYLTRCQYLLRQGKFVADIVYLTPEGAPQSVHVPVAPGTFPSRPGHNFDGISPEALMTQFSVKEGRLVTPSGMSYRLLSLPAVKTMTPKLLRKISDLVEAGAIVIGPPPIKSPSLEGYPACDDEVKTLAGKLWGDCNGRTVKEHAFGQGKIIWGEMPDEVLAKMNVPPDFSYDDSHSGPGLVWIHRRAEDTDLYFVANKRYGAVEGTATFRVQGKTPELWWPESGRTEAVAAYSEKDGVTTMPLHLDSAQSVFVVFRAKKPALDPIASVTLDGQPVLPTPKSHPTIVIQKASYGIPSDPTRMRNVQALLQEMVDSGTTSFPVSSMDVGGDPAPNIVKTLTFDYTVNGMAESATGTDPQSIALTLPNTSAPQTARYGLTPEGKFTLEAWKAGAYELTTASGKTLQASVPALPTPLDITGPWSIEFPPNWGAPDKISLDALASWSDNAEAGVKYFSGTATYRKTFDVPAAMQGAGHHLYLDLGDVQVMAQVQLNGKDLGVLWKAPYAIDVTDALQAIGNQLEVKVTNLWPNRQIGDQQLPTDAEYEDDRALKALPQWLVDNKPSPSGRFTFTSWKLWKKDDALVKSGLIGPVTLRPSTEVTVSSSK